MNDESITNKPTIKTYKIWRYCKQTNNKTLHNMKVLQTDQQQNLTQYEGITNKLARKL
jgi:hypothetical protein